MGSSETASRVMKFLGFVLAGLLGCMVLALLLAQAPGSIGHAGLGITILFASASVGALLGFLFAVPRVNAPGVAGGATDRDTDRKPLLQTNTNLERISDWLSTMLVGVGLSQLTNINRGLVSFRDTVAEQIRCSPEQACAAMPMLAPIILIFGVIAGFLFMYLYTRIELVGQFRKAEQDNLLSKDRDEEVKRVVQEAQAEGTANFAVVQAANDPAPITINKAVELMFSLLYQPDQFARVIEIAGQLSGTGAVKRADYWFYLAAAFGQQLSAARSRGDDDAATSARDNALDAARRAIRIDPRYRTRLWNISDPNSSDDDLSPLRDDPDFLAIAKPPAR